MPDMSTSAAGTKNDVTYEVPSGSSSSAPDKIEEITTEKISSITKEDKEEDSILISTSSLNLKDQNNDNNNILDEEDKFEEIDINNDSSITAASQDVKTDTPKKSQNSVEKYRKEDKSELSDGNKRAPRHPWYTSRPDEHDTSHNRHTSGHDEHDPNHNWYTSGHDEHDPNHNWYTSRDDEHETSHNWYTSRDDEHETSHNWYTSKPDEHDTSHNRHTSGHDECDPSHNWYTGAPDSELANRYRDLNHNNRESKAEDEDSVEKYRKENKSEFYGGGKSNPNHNWYTGAPDSELANRYHDLNHNNRESKAEDEGTNSVEKYRKENKSEFYGDDEYDSSHNWYTFGQDVEMRNRYHDLNCNRESKAEDEGTSNQQGYDYSSTWGIETDASGIGTSDFNPDQSYGQETTSDWGWRGKNGQGANTSNASLEYEVDGYDQQDDDNQNSETSFWKSGVNTHSNDNQQIIMRPSDADIVKQHNIIMKEQANVSLIGELQALSNLEQEYKNGNDIFVSKLKYLQNEYKSYRPVRRDGNCFFRSFIFSYLETLIENKAFSEKKRILEHFESCKDKMISVGIQELVFEDALGVLQDRVKQIGDRQNNLTVFEWELVMNDDHMSNFIVMFLRLLTSAEIQQRKDFFEPFIMGISEILDVELFCRKAVEVMNEESDEIHIRALTDALMIPVRVHSLDSRSPVEVMPTDYIPEALEKKEVVPFVHLLYRPGHYDILYLK